jgi:hypothetical protein
MKKTLSFTLCAAVVTLASSAALASATVNALTHNALTHNALTHNGVEAGSGAMRLQGVKLDGSRLVRF